MSLSKFDNYKMTGRDYMSNDSFSVFFNMMKIRYMDYDNSFDTFPRGTIVPTDKINLFINLESVILHMTNVQDVDKKVLTEPDITKRMISNILNLAAHYKKFFCGHGLDTQIFLYMTDLNSHMFRERDYDEDYRSLFENKFNTNRQNVPLTELLTQDVLPQAKEICEFLPDVHLIITRNLDSSVVPGIISKAYPDRKNCIVTTDYIETQYAMRNNFIVHLLHRTYQRSLNAWNINGYFELFFSKKVWDPTTDLSFIGNENLYTAMICCLGSSIRSVSPTKSVGIATTFKMVKNALSNSDITPTTESLDLLRSIFKSNNEAADNFEHNFRLLSINRKEDNLSDEDVFKVKNQLANRIDTNSLIKLNETTFKSYPIMLEELTMHPNTR